MSALTPYLKTIASRRTIYALKPELPAGVSIKDIQDTIQAVIKNTPTAFNSQGNRAIILTGETHRQVWDAVAKAIDNEDGKKRPLSVRDEAYGSVIFFTDDKVTEKLQADFPAWSAAFPQFGDHSSGAAQISSWTALETLGLGAHLQHYNGYVKAALPGKIPESWSVHSQLCFGAPGAPAGEKSFAVNKVELFN
ncbi:nitroreductase family protein NDAI_0A00490 [Naumovozyma dairenensis CBS 421]|uniref:Nitroreductase domain-containing protein n=1 Tax=Naumovozyma dairenensis (strain ATCC 10597 / BCRC 20456 / CBS 421 / NBRC 0211 / NRRL Y-12639) TaxID=1071378 RepID=G0W319_NAUDC|nr:hypothetical protein NDAI_0A00490 [Naumovozyma dairenensis CBS 421]CCD22207.1 hypothetical protein NDAI_0A00490 [Naumovozyma dairenensis CBS 421]